MNVYRKIVAWLKRQGYFEIHPVVRRIVIQGFIGTMIASTPFFWKITDAWPIAPLVMLLVLVVKELMDDANSGLPRMEYFKDSSVRHLLQSGIGVLLAIFILITVASSRLVF